jgi:hypothetical protein
VYISDSTAGELASPVPGQCKDMGLKIDFAVGARSGLKSSQGGADSSVSEPVLQELKSVSKDPSGVASLAPNREPSGVASLTPAREPDRGGERSQLHEPSQEDAYQAEEGQEHGEGAHRGEEMCQAQVDLEQDTSLEPGRVRTNRDRPVPEEPNKEPSLVPSSMM